MCPWRGISISLLSWILLPSWRVPASLATGLGAWCSSSGSLVTRWWCPRCGVVRLLVSWVLYLWYGVPGPVTSGLPVRLCPWCGNTVSLVTWCLCPWCGLPGYLASGLLDSRGDADVTSVSSLLCRWCGVLGCLLLGLSWPCRGFLGPLTSVDALSRYFPDPILSRYLVLVGGLSGPLRRPVPTLVLLPGFSGFRRCLVRSRFAVPSGTPIPVCN